MLTFPCKVKLLGPSCYLPLVFLSLLCPCASGGSPHHCLPWPGTRARSTELARIYQTLTKPLIEVLSMGGSALLHLRCFLWWHQHYNTHKGTDIHSVIAALFVANISFYHWNKINRTYSTRTSSLKPLMTALTVGPCEQFIRYLIEKELLSLVLIKKNKSWKLLTLW